MGESRADHRDRRIRYAPESQAAIARGVYILERTLGPTIGPGARPVAMARTGRPGQPPELLDDAATIARRMVGISDRFENMGFMLARQAAWRMHARVGDGAASAVAIGAETLRSLQRLAAAGFSPLELVDGADRAVDRVCEVVAALAEPLSAGESTGFLSRQFHDPPLAEVMREAVGVAGPDVTMVCRSSVSPRAHLQWIEGALWESTSVLAPTLVPGCEPLRLAHPAVVLWDDAIDDVQQCVAAMSRLGETGASSAVLIARRFAPEVLGLIVRNSGLPCAILPVLAPQAGPQQDDAFGDLEALVAARRLTPVAGDRLDRIDLVDVGSAARITVGHRLINVMAKRANQPSIDRRILAVEHALERCGEDNERERLLTRLGRLRQGMGIVWVGARSEIERDRYLQQATRGLAGLRAARASGVVPGGGATLLAAARDLRCPARDGVDPGASAVAAGIVAPARWLARNAGLASTPAVERGLAVAPCRGLDVVSGAMVDLRECGIVDPATAVAAMVRVGVSMAIAAFECDVLVQRPVRLSQAEIGP